MYENDIIDIKNNKANFNSEHEKKMPESRILQTQNRISRDSNTYPGIIMRYFIVKTAACQ